MKHLLMMPVMVLMSLFANSQKQKMIVGNRIPKIVFDKLYNTEYRELEIQRIKNKIVILDFWITRCGTCLKQTPKLAALQKKFKDELLIVMVTSEKKAVVEKFFEQRPELKELGLPVAYDAAFMDAIVTVPSYPYIVWIDKEKALHALTGGDDLTEKNIKALVGGKDILITTKEQRRFEYGQTLLQAMPEHADKVRYSSILFDSTSDKGAQQRKIEYDEERKQILCINYSVNRLYASAYRFAVNFNIHPESLIINKSKKINSETKYCYELIYSKKYTDEDAFRIMQEDLDKGLGLKSEVVKIKRQVYIVKVADSTKLKLPSGKGHIEHVDFVEFNNLKFEELSNVLTTRVAVLLPVICEGDKNRLVSFQIRKRYNSFEEIKEHLWEYGINISIGEREIDCLVLSDG